MIPNALGFRGGEPAISHPVYPGGRPDRIMVQAESAAGGDRRVMSSRQVFTSRLRNRPLLDSEGLTIGRVRDVVILPSAGQDPPRALGLVVTLQPRRIFVNLGQITEISVDAAHLPGGAAELDRFTRPPADTPPSSLPPRSPPPPTAPPPPPPPPPHPPSV